MEFIIKRDGNKVQFEAEKIENAIAKAFVSTNEVPARDVSAMARAIELMVVTSLGNKGIYIPTVEQIQDEVENSLMKCGYQATAKAYILYRSQHEKVREIKQPMLDYAKLVDGYIGTEKDWRV